MLITAESSSTDDHPWLLPMIEESAGNTKGLETVTLADAGYHSGANLLACESGATKFSCPEPIVVSGWLLTIRSNSFTKLRPTPTSAP